MTTYRERHLAGHYTLGTVGTTTTDPKPAAAKPAANEATDLDEMTKAELLEHAQTLGVTPANQGMTKDELRASIDAFLS